MDHQSRSSFINQALQPCMKKASLIQLQTLLEK